MTDVRNRCFLRGLVLGLLLAPVAMAKTIVVGPNGPFVSLQQAVLSASRGDLIRIESGTYQGNLLLDKPLTLEGIGSPIIHGDGRGSIVTVAADACTIRGLRIEHSGDMLVDEDSGILLKSSGNIIEHNELRDVLFGIYLYASNDNDLRQNVIRGRATLEIGERGNGIHIWNSGRNRIVGNTIIAARDGMYLQNANRSEIRENRVSDLRYGLHYMFSDDNLFEGNVFEHNIAGAAIMYSRRIDFRRNKFVHNRGFSSFGVLFQEDDDCVAEENAIVDNEVGIFMEALRGSRFTRNLVATNDTAIEIFSSASGNTFERNNFIGNLSPMWVIGKDTATHWNGSQAGNYWSDYEGYDLDANGIGDVPFKIQNVFEHLEGNYPRLRLYLFSPAAQGLALAEKALPVIAGSKEYDFLPLVKPVELPAWMTESGERARNSLYSMLLPLAMVVGSIVVIAKGALR